MIDKRQKVTKVKCKRDESTTKQSIFLEYIFFRKSIYVSPEVLLELVRKRSQNFTIIDQEKHKIKPVYIWNPMTIGFFM